MTLLQNPIVNSLNHTLGNTAYIYLLRVFCFKNKTSLIQIINTITKYLHLIIITKLHHINTIYFKTTYT